MKFPRLHHLLRFGKTTNTSMQKGRPESLVWLILLLGIVFRIWQMFHQVFWFDEAFTYHISRLPSSQIIPAVLLDNNPPLYYLLMHIVTLTSSDPLVLRIPSFLFNLGSVFFMYKITAKIGRINSRALIISVLFLSPLAVHIGINARLHTLASFFISVIVFMFLRVLEKPTVRSTILFLLFSIAGLYTQYYVALIFVPMSAIVYTDPNRKIRKSWLLLLTVIALAFAPWLMAAAKSSHTVCSCPPTLLALPATLASPILNGMGEITLRRYGELPFPLILFFTVAASFYIFYLLKGIRMNRILTLLYLLPLSLVSIAGLAAPLFSPKGFAIFSPIYLALVSVGMSSTKHASKLILVNLAMFGAINIILLTHPFFAGTPILPLVQIMRASNYAIAHTSPITYYSSLAYLPNHKQILLTKNPYPTKLVEYIVGTKSDIKEDMFWLVDTQSWVGVKDRHDALLPIQDRFQSIQENNFQNVTLFLMKP